MLPQLDANRLNAYRALESKGRLTVRLKGHWDWNTRYADVPAEQMAERFATRQQRGPVTDLIDPDGVKIYTDGVPSGFGSPYVEPYVGTDDYGKQYINQSALSAAVTKFDKEGLHVMMHAVGDLAVRQALNAAEAARKANGSGGSRHHISHSCSWQTEDYDRPGALNVSLDLSPPTTPGRPAR